MVQRSSFFSHMSSLPPVTLAFPEGVLSRCLLFHCSDSSSQVTHAPPVPTLSPPLWDPFFSINGWEQEFSPPDTLYGTPFCSALRFCTSSCPVPELAFIWDFTPSLLFLFQTVMVKLSPPQFPGSLGRLFFCRLSSPLYAFRNSNLSPPLIHVLTEKVLFVLYSPYSPLQHPLVKDSLL